MPAIIHLLLLAGADLKAADQWEETPLTSFKVFIQPTLPPSPSLNKSLTPRGPLSS